MFVNQIDQIDQIDQIYKMNGKGQIPASHFLFDLWKGKRDEETVRGVRGAGTNPC